MKESFFHDSRMPSISDDVNGITVSCLPVVSDDKICSFEVALGLFIPPVESVFFLLAAWNFFALAAFLKRSRLSAFSETDASSGIFVSDFEAITLALTEIVLPITALAYFRADKVGFCFSPKARSEYTDDLSDSGNNSSSERRCIVCW